MSTRTLATGTSVNSPPVTPLRTCRRLTRAGGFTLIEILVVILIVGILAVGAVLSLGGVGRDSGLEQERDRLAALIDYARDRGEVQTLEYGIHCTPTGYRFLIYDPRQAIWVPDTLDDVLRAPRELPAGLLITLMIEGREVVLDDPKAAPGAAPLTPQVLLLSSGEINSFVLTLRRAGTRRSAALRTSSDGSGVEVGAVEEAS